MTTVYGVTFVGARAQIEKQLKEKSELSEEECWEASGYVTQKVRASLLILMDVYEGFSKVLSSITNLFSGARAIQHWLNLCARLISKSIPPDRVERALETVPATRWQAKKLRLRKEQMTSVVWTTGMGLPVVQPYRKTKKKQIATALQSVYISDPYSQAEGEPHTHTRQYLISDVPSLGPVNTVKQASAFPPNFIHSLDATHMMLTALECRVSLFRSNETFLISPHLLPRLKA
jgi:DNA-directed RNA polymerase